MLPIAVVLMLYSQEILLLWTQNRSIAENIRLVLSFFRGGSVLNALMNLPLALQLAYGWTRLALPANIVAIILLAPFMYIMSLHWGGEGATLVWIILNAGYVVVILRLTHKRISRGELQRWFGEDVGPPLVVTLSVAGALKWIVPIGDSAIAVFGSLVFVSIATFAAAVVRLFRCGQR